MYALVDAAMMPMRAAGAAIMIQPKAATNDSICARAADLADSTRWKYTCNSVIGTSDVSIATILVHFQLCSMYV